MSRPCRKDCEPEVDNSSIECDGDFVYEECVVVNQNTYFGLVQGDFLTKLILTLEQRLKSIWIAIGRKIDYTTLQVYSNDSEAASGGIEVGKPYKTSDGYVKIRMS